jgi:hypothetical protein
MSEAQSTQVGGAMPADAGDDGFTCVLTPIQLACVMQGESISEPETWTNRLFNRLIGGVELVAGAAELTGAGALLAAPEPTMLTKAGGVVLGVHGLDTTANGAYEVWTGQQRNPFIQQGAEAAARALGASPGAASIVGVVVEIMVPSGVAVAAGASRVMSIRRGVMFLEEEEAAGGHTIAKHVAKDRAFLLNRLATERIPAAGTFANSRVAASAISRTIRANPVVIKDWVAQGAIRPLAIELDMNEAVGQLIKRGSTELQTASKVRVVLKRALISGKDYFVLTSYPIP